jgi:hypothetical protein
MLELYLIWPVFKNALEKVYPKNPLNQVVILHMRLMPLFLS